MHKEIMKPNFLLFQSYQLLLITASKFVLGFGPFPGKAA
jgi:hypothetical protein